jgi:hypothetical protein
MIQEMSMTKDDHSNMDLMDRQVELNEWTYHDKMETLFMSQMIFMGLLVAAIFTILSKYGFFNRGFVYIIMVIISIVIGLVWFFKDAFTRNVRDRRYWNKRHFTGDSKTDSVIPPGELAAAAKQLIDTCTARRNAAAGGSSNCVP